MSRITPQLRQHVLDLDGYFCAYCRLSEVLSGISLSVDHIIPVAKQGKSTLENLCAACRSCNEFKGVQTDAVDNETGHVVPLFNPRRQVWSEHFQWSATGTVIIGLTACGRATIYALKLNNAVIVKARTRWVSAGWHPPH